MYTLKENEDKMVRPGYDPETGEFKGLHKTVDFLVVGGSPEEVFFNYGFDKEKSKILYSHYRKKIPNSFSGTIFNRHRAMIESGEVEGEFSNIFFFLPSIIDRSEEIDKYLNNVLISPIVITQQQLNGWAETSFDPSKLDMYAVIKCLKHMNNISIATSCAMQRDCFLEKKLMLRWPGLESINRGFHLTNLKFLIDFCCR